MDLTVPEDVSDVSLTEANENPIPAPVAADFYKASKNDRLAYEAASLLRKSMPTFAPEASTATRLTYSNPLIAHFANGDVNKLVSAERFADMVSKKEFGENLYEPLGVAESIELGQVQAEYGEEAYNSYFGQPSDKLARLAQRRASLSARLDRESTLGWLTGVGLSSFSQMATTADEALTGAAVAGGTVAATGIGIPFAPAAAIKGGLAGMFAATAKQYWGAQYGDMMGQKSIGGLTMDKDVAFWTAGATGVVRAALEVGVLGKIARVGAITKAIEAGASKTAQQIGLDAALSQQIKSISGSALGKIAVGSALEGGQEGLDTALELLGTNIAQEIDGAVYDNPLFTKENLKQVLAATFAGAAIGGPIAAIGVGVESLQEDSFKASFRSQQVISQYAESIRNFNLNNIIFTTLADSELYKSGGEKAVKEYIGNLIASNKLSPNIEMVVSDLTRGKFEAPLIADLMAVATVNNLTGRMSIASDEFHAIVLKHNASKVFEIAATAELNSMIRAKKVVDWFNDPTNELRDISLDQIETKLTSLDELDALIKEALGEPVQPTMTDAARQAGLVPQQNLTMDEPTPTVPVVDSGNVVANVEQQSNTPNPLGGKLKQEAVENKLHIAVKRLKDQGLAALTPELKATLGEKGAETYIADNINILVNMMRVFVSDRSKLADRLNAIDIRQSIGTNESISQDEGGKIYGETQAKLGVGAIVTLLEKANPSTLIHELAHVALIDYLRNYKEGDVALKTLLDYAGLSEQDGKDIVAYSRGNLSTDNAAFVKLNENFARGFEAYLRDGKAPTPRLESMFARFRKLLVAVYNTALKLGKDFIGLTDEMREFYADLVSGNELRARIREQNQFDLDLANARRASPIAKNLTKFNEVVSDAIDAMVNVISEHEIAALKREVTKARNKIRNRLKSESPHNKKDAFIAAGGLNSLIIPPNQINARRLQALNNAGLISDEGISIAESAKILEVDESNVLSSIATIYELEKQIDAEFLVELSAILDSFIDTYETPKAYSAFLELKSNLYAVAAGKVKTSMEDVFAIAFNHDGSMLNELNKTPEQYRQAIDRATRDEASMLIEHAKATSEVDKQAAMELAYAASVEQLILRAQYIAAKQVTKWKKNISDKLARMLNADKSKMDVDAVHMAYSVAIQAGLIQLPQVPKELRFDKDRLKEYLDNASSSLKERHDGSWLLNGFTRAKVVNKKNGKGQKITTDLSYNELRDTVYMINDIEALGKKKAIQSNAELNKILDEINSQVDAAMARTDGWVATHLDKLSEKMRENVILGWAVSARNHILQMDTFFEMMDGVLIKDGSEKAFFHQLFYRPALDAEVDAMHRQSVYKHNMVGTKGMHAKIEKAWRDTDRFKDSGLAPLDPDEKLSVGQVMMLAMHLGNAHNRAAVLSSYNLTEDTVRQYVSRLTKDELDIVNHWWEVLDEMFPDFAKVYEDVNGVKVLKVKSEPFTITLSDGTEVKMRGGYMPLHDRGTLEVEDKEAHEANLNEMFGFEGIHNIGGNPNISAGEMRTKWNPERKVSLNSNVLNRHIYAVTRFTAFAKHVQLLAKAFREGSKLSNYIRDRYGKEMLREVREWVKHLARPSGVYQTNFDRGMQQLASNFSTVAMTTRPIWSSALNFAQGVPAAIIEVGPTHFANGLKMSLDVKNREFAIQSSPFIQSQIQLLDSNAHFEIVPTEQSSKLTAKTQRAMNNAAWMFQKMSDLGVIIPAFLGAYEKSLAMHGDIAKAISDANLTINRITPRLTPTTSSSWSRQKGILRMFVALTSWSTLMMNRQLSHLRNGTNSQRIQYLFAITIGAAMIREALLWLCDDEEEREIQWGRVTSDIASSSVLGLPMVGWLVQGAARKYAGVQTFTPGGIDTVVNTLTNAVVAPKVMITALSEDDDEKRNESLTSIAKAVGLVTGIPVPQLLSAYVDAWKDYDEEDVSLIGAIVGKADVK